jgi:MFS transporter, ACS family, inner membrane transport protein
MADSPALASAIVKARWRLMPLILVMYLIAMLDRTNIGFAKQALRGDAGVSDAAFALGAGVFFITYAIFELPSNLVLHRIGARIWMCRIMVTWGLVAAAMMFTRGDWSFLGLRLLLGAAEAGFFPGAILYITYWFPAKERGRALGLLYFGFPIALTVGSPLSGGLLALDGALGLAGWQWMFLIEGLLACAVGIYALWGLTDHPKDAAWLTAEERTVLSDAIAHETTLKQDRGGLHLGRALMDPRLLHLLGVYFFLQISVYGVTFYLPSQVSALLGIKIGPIVGLVTGIPWLCAALMASYWPARAVRTGKSRPYALAFLLFIAGGLVVSANVPPVLAVIALCFVTTGAICVQPIFWTFPTGYLGGVAAAGGIAAINSLGNLGGFVAPNVRNWADAHFGGTAAGLYVLAFAALVSAALVLILPSRIVYVPGSTDEAEPRPARPTLAPQRQQKIS